MNLSPETTEIAKCIGISAGVALSSALLMHGVRRGFAMAQDEEAAAAIGTFVSFVATLFTFVLGFTIVNLWTFFSDADRLAQHEATRLRTMYRMAQDMPGGEVLRGTLREYTKSVATDEWVTMTSGKMDEKTDRLKDKVWSETVALVKIDGQNEAMAASLLESLVDMNDARRQRISMLGSKLHPLLTMALGASALLTVVGFIFLVIKNRKVQFVVDFTMAGVIALNFYLLQALNNPFNGVGFSVPNEAFATLNSRMEQEQERAPVTKP